jgi:hypothetical protein
MKKFNFFLLVFSIFYGCGNNELPEDFLGTYNGVQPEHFLKNQYGDDMVINGQRVPIPSIDNKFLFEEGGAVKLQQTNLDDNSRVYYEGSYTITSEEHGIYKLICRVSEGTGSSPTYLITLNSDKTGICKHDAKTAGPEFNLTKTN